jgi:hypothetical protein
MRTITNALPAFLVASSGVGLAWLGYRVSAWLPIVLVGAFVGIGLTCQMIGRARLESDPVTGVRIMQWLGLWPFGLAIGAAALAIAAAVWLEPGENASVETKKLFAASVAGITAFLTAAWIKSAEEAADQWIGTPIKNAFQDVFRTRFDPESTPALAIFNDEWQGRGWATAADRRARAQAVAEGIGS